MDQIKLNLRSYYYLNPEKVLKLLKSLKPKRNIMPIPVMKLLDSSFTALELFNTFLLRNSIQSGNFMYIY